MHLVSRLLATEHLLQWPGRTMTSRDDVTTTPVEGPACRQIDDGVDKPISQRAAAAAAAAASSSSRRWPGEQGARTAGEY